MGWVKARSVGLNSTGAHVSQKWRTSDSLLASRPSRNVLIEPRQPEKQLSNTDINLTLTVETHGHTAQLRTLKKQVHV